MTVRVPRWLKVGAVLATITGVGCWVAAAVVFLLAIGPPRNTGGLVIAGVLCVAGSAFLIVFTFVNYKVRRRNHPPTPLDPERAAAVRRATAWTFAAWAPMAAGLGWLV